MTPHDEVLTALEALAAETGIPDGHGEKVRVDRRSQLRHLGIRTPDRRRRVSQGFSFTADEPEAVLAQWNEIWMATECADVAFAVLDHYRSHVERVALPGFWPTASVWIERVDNWAHADDLGRVYSHALEADRHGVLPTVRAWSRGDALWHRRVAVVSLVHYSGKNAVFMPVDVVLDVVATCVDDQRPDVAKAVGWVLRETSAADPDEVAAFCEANASVMSASTMKRATQKLEADRRDELVAAAATRRREG